MLKQAAFLLIALLGISPLPAAPDPTQPTPPVELVLGKVWRNMELQSFSLKGNVRANKQLIPLELQTKERQMLYLFPSDSLQIRVLFKPGSTELSSRVSASAAWAPVPVSKLSTRILGTDMTYEDLGLHFLNWENTQPAGLDSIKTLKSFAFDATPAPGQSQYAKVRYWITAEHFLVIRADAFNTAGQVIKRVEVNGVMQIGDAWALKEMQIATLIPGRDLSASKTILEILEGQEQKAVTLSGDKK